MSEQSSDVFVKQVFTCVSFTVEWAFNIYSIPKSSIFSLLSSNNSEIRFSLVLFFCYYIYFKCFWKEEFIKVWLFSKKHHALLCEMTLKYGFQNKCEHKTCCAFVFLFRIICSEIWMQTMQTMQNCFWSCGIQRKSHLHNYWEPWQKYLRFCSPGKSWLLLSIYC